MKNQKLSKALVADISSIAMDSTPQERKALKKLFRQIEKEIKNNK